MMDNKIRLDGLKWLVKKKPLMPLFLKAVLNKGMSNNRSISQISRDINTTYAYMNILVKELIDKGLIRTEKIGRKKKVYLTKKGQEIILKILEIDRELL